ncbi:NADH-quinone oxidoreductase subunit M [soil metagenome]
MLTAAILIPLLGALGYALIPRVPTGMLRPVAIAVATVPLLLLIGVWTTFDPSGPLFQAVESVPWIPTVGASFTLGVDGIALPLAVMTALLFIAAIAFPVEDDGRLPAYLAWMLFLEAVSIGLFLALDLLLFYVFFDLSLVGMYFLIARWGHGDPKRAAMKFFLYTLIGSLVLLLGILSLALAGEAVTFDLRTLIDTQPLAGQGLRAGLTLFAVLFGFAIKTPLVPVHTWLPAAHVDAPGPGSTILAGVLLKMGVFGMIRIAYAPMADTFGRYAIWLGGFAVLSIIWGALVALGQTDMKRRIAYTSITHMGYSVLGIAVAGIAGAGQAHRLAIAGATLEMVAHGLIAGALFLITGAVWSRAHGYEMSRFGGLASKAPQLTGAAMLASFASLGLPGLAGFVAEFQIFTGALAVAPILAGLALVGVLLTAALFLQMLQQVFLGDTPADLGEFPELATRELIPLVLLLLPVVIIGIAPAFLIDPMSATADALATMVS